MPIPSCRIRSHCRDALTKLGVRVDALFFPADYEPALPHEYQFNLDTEAGRLALDRSVAFLNGL